MSSVQTIEVHTAPAYEVTIGAGLRRDCGARLKAVLGGCRIAVAADSNVAPLYLETVCASLRDAGFAVCSYVFPAGEAHKNFTTLSAILEFLAESQLTRTDCVAALGGGVTGDMAGFAAASYLRGIRYVQLPTTLLSAVDSSVGGKTAIDLAAGKNLAGAFLQPAAVLCDTDCLRSLPAAVFADGAAEAIKTGVLSGETLFSLFEDGTLTDAPAEVIARCIRYKAGVVERDEKERGERRKLNLGHTVGHAIEKCSGYAIPHGHAVAAGLAVMARASERLGWAEPGVSARIAACLEKNGLPTGEHVVAVLDPKIDEAHLARLRRAGVSYVFQGDGAECTEREKLSAALAALEETFGVKRLLLEGGGVLNGSFLAAGLIKEISVLVCPTVDGRSESAKLFSWAGSEELSPAEGVRLKLLEAEPLVNGVVWLHYLNTLA